MHIDARMLENDSLIEGDICIVGSGAAGISMALEWIDTPYKIILLEGGGFEVEGRMQDLYRGNTTGQRYFPLHSSRLHILAALPAIGQAFVLHLIPSISAKETGFPIVAGLFSWKTCILTICERNPCWTWGLTNMT
jgi:choline dehydrogenase-like flavoprotein